MLFMNSPKKVMIRTLKDDLFIKVEKIDFFSSISETINIGLTLVDDIQLGDINLRD